MTFDTYTLSRSTSGNSKTGPIPYASVRSDHWGTGCAGCPMFERDCYAIHGRAALHMDADRSGSMAARAQREPKQYTLRAAVVGALRLAKYFRFSNVGDSVGSIPREHLEPAYRTALADNLEPIDYTSRWSDPDNGWARSWAMASCHSVDDVDTALSMGWRATVTVDPDAVADVIESGARRMTVADPETGAEVEGVICPAMVASYTGDRPMTCNDCGLCSVHRYPPGRTMSGGKRGRAARDLVIFAQHGFRGIGRRWSVRLKAYRAGGEA